MTTNDDQNPTTSGLPSYGSVPPPPEGSYPPPPPEGSYPPPPPPPGAPAPGGYGGGPSPYSAPDAIGYGWRKFKENAGAMVLATLLVVAVTIALAVISESIAPSPSMVAYDGSFEFDGSGLVASVIVQTIIGAAGYFFFAMLTMGAIQVVDGKKFEIGAAFAPLKFPKLFVTGIVLSIASTIGFMLCILPGLIFTIFSYFTIFYVIDKDESPFQAIRSSFKLVSDNLGQALLSGLLVVLVILGGALLCLVGLLAAIPVVTIAGAYAYRRFQGQPVAP
jgi:uncharacterized membrane protein